MSGPANAHHGAGRFSPPYEPGSLADHLARCGSSDLGYYTFAELLEAALTKLHELHVYDVINDNERKELVRLLLAARRGAEIELPRQFPREKIDLGFQGAVGVAAVWAQPFADRGGLSDSLEVWQLWLRMFLADVENVNRASRLGKRPPPMVLFDLNQLDTARADNVVSFPLRSN